MPVVKPKAPPPTTWDLHLTAAVGTHQDFYILGMCPDLDDDEKDRNIDHGEFTHVLRYQGRQRTLIERVAVRINRLYQPKQGPILGVGEPLGYLEIDPSGVTEVGLPHVPGTFTGIWGAGPDHVFACGAHAPFIYYRKQGHWQTIPLPQGTTQIQEVWGLRESEVYFVGDAGQILLWDGRLLQRLQVPTTRYLTGIAPLDDRTLCVCGYQGTLLMGNRTGWRIVPTHVDDNLLAIAALNGQVYYGADDVVWAFDGSQLPVQAIAAPAHYITGLEDGLVLSFAEESRLYHAGQLTDLDTKI